MMGRRTSGDDSASQANDAPATHPSGTKPTPAPGKDPTNPCNQESTGDWVAGERAAERRDPEPGVTDRDRQHRKY